MLTTARGPHSTGAEGGVRWDKGGDNFIHTLVILSSPADTMVMRSLSCSGSSCSFSSLNQLQKREGDNERKMRKR